MVHLWTEVSFDLCFSGLKAVHESLGALVSVLLQPSKVVADGAPDFGLPTGKPGGHALHVFWGVDVSADFNFNLGFGSDPSAPQEAEQYRRGKHTSSPEPVFLSMT